MGGIGRQTDVDDINSCSITLLFHVSDCDVISGCNSDLSMRAETKLYGTRHDQGQTS